MITPFLWWKTIKTLLKAENAFSDAAIKSRRLVLQRKENSLFEWWLQWDFHSCNISALLFDKPWHLFLRAPLSEWQFLLASVHFSLLYEYENSWLDLCCLWALWSVTWVLPLLHWHFSAYLSGHVFQTFGSTPVGWTRCFFVVAAAHHTWPSPFYAAPSPRMWWWMFI